MEQFREKLNLKYILADMTPGKNKHRKFFIASQKKMCDSEKKQLERKQQWKKIQDKI